MLHVKEGEFRSPRDGNHRGKQSPDHGTITETEQQKAKREKPHPEERKLHPENRPLVGSLARIGAQTDGERQGKQEGNGKSRPRDRHPYPEGSQPVGNHGAHRPFSPIFLSRGRISRHLREMTEPVRRLLPILSAKPRPGKAPTPWTGPHIFITHDRIVIALRNPEIPTRAPNAPGAGYE
jgi:hypothetical protein